MNLLERITRKVIRFDISLGVSHYCSFNKKYFFNIED